MSLDDLYKDILSLQKEIEENEKKFDSALQHTPSQVELARIIYKDIKALESRLADMQILFDQNSDA